jgi:hypothetical protein
MLSSGEVAKVCRAFSLRAFLPGGGFIRPQVGIFNVRVSIEAEPERTCVIWKTFK